MLSKMTDDNPDARVPTPLSTARPTNRLSSFNEIKSALEGTTGVAGSLPYLNNRGGLMVLDFVGRWDGRQ